MNIDDFLQKNNFQFLEKELSKGTEEESFPDSDKSSPNQIFFTTNLDNTKNSSLSQYINENIFLPSPDKSKISEFSNNPHNSDEYNSSENPMLLNSNDKSMKISKPMLRKKICSKLAKTFQGSYGIEKLKSQQLTLQLEAKIRMKYPDMDASYKSTLKAFIRFLKV